MCVISTQTRRQLQKLSFCSAASLSLSPPQLTHRTAPSVFKFTKKKKLGAHLSARGVRSLSSGSGSDAAQVVVATTTPTAPTPTNTTTWCNGDELRERVPALVSKFVSLLSSVEDGVDSKGLFRVVPDKVREQLKATRAALNIAAAHGDADSVDVGKLCSSAHVAAHVFKRYLQSLPEPLFSYALYDSFVMTHSIGDQEEKLNELRRLLKQLPAGFKETAKILLSFFWQVIRASAKNGVTFDRFVVWFAPTFLRAEEDVYYMQNDAAAVAAILKLMVENNQSLFRTPVGLAAQRRTRSTTLKRLTTSAPLTTVTIADGASPTGAADLSAASAAGVSRVVMRNTALDSLLPIAPAGSSASKSFYPLSMTDDEIKRSLKAELQRTTSLTKAAVSSSASASASASTSVPPTKPPPRSESPMLSLARQGSESKLWQHAVPPGVSDEDRTSGDGSSEDVRSSARDKRSAGERRRHRTGTGSSSRGTPSADASEEGSPRRQVSTSKSTRRRGSIASEEVVEVVDDPLGAAAAVVAATASVASATAAPAAPAALVSAAAAAGDSTTIEIAHAGTKLSVTMLKRDTLDTLLEMVSKAAGATIVDVRVVSIDDNAEIGLLSQSSESPFATHFGMIGERLGFAYETVPRKKHKKRAATLTEDDATAQIVSRVHAIKRSIETATVFSDAIALSAAVRDSLKLVNNVVKLLGADVDALREFKSAHPRAPLERVALATTDEQIAAELNNLLDIVLPLMDQLLDLSAYVAAERAQRKATPDGVDSPIDLDEVLRSVCDILATATKA
jgi:hypothetical protein